MNSRGAFDTATIVRMGAPLDTFDSAQEHALNAALRVSDQILYRRQGEPERRSHVVKAYGFAAPLGWHEIFDD
jgi:hypothetical protein